MSGDFIESTKLTAFQERLVYGPATVVPGVGPDYRDRLTRFAAAIEGDKCRFLLDWWTARAIDAATCPPRGRCWISELAAIARNLQLFEHETGTRRLRFRYYGQAMVERIGQDRTGKLLTDVNTRTEEDTWQNWRPAIEEGRPVFCRVNYSHTGGRRYLKAGYIVVPVRDEAGLIRFCLSVVDYLDVPSGG